MAWGRDGRDSRNIKLGLTVLISPSCRQPCQLLGSNQRFKSACQHRCTHTPSTSHRQTCTCDCLCPIWGGRAGLHQLEAVGIPIQLKSNYTGNFFLTPENGSFGSRVIPPNSLLGRSFEELGKSQGTEAKPLNQARPGVLEKTLWSTRRHFSPPFAHKNIDSTSSFSLSCSKLLKD